ncbi:MAG: T9SS type A sorting domain-containing protein [Chitinophagales bacterium]|nr:T9SS type A sorting domain-containing protein [Chitinophagales bacterium]
MKIFTNLLLTALAFLMVNFAMAKPTVTIDHVVDPSCTGGDGEIMISVTGGVPPYSYMWSTGDTTEDISGVSAGDITCTVTDANGDIVSESVNLSSMGDIHLSSTVTSASHCNANDGSVVTNISGGTGAYVFQWSNGSQNQMLTNVSSGTYSLTLIDDQCQIFKNYNVTYDQAITLSGTETNESSPHSSDGAVNISVSGGNTYQYLWSNGSTNQNISNLSAGTYCVTVDDPNIGCPQTACFSITDLNTATPVIVDASCSGNNDGRIELSTSGGTPPYTFTWSNGMTTEDIANLYSGTYHCTVSDNNGFQILSTFVIDDAPPISTHVVKKNEKTDNSSDGSLNITVSGGNSPYTYLWSTGETTEDISGLTYGNYCVTITDAFGCEQISCEFISTINQPPFFISDKGIYGTPETVVHSNNHMQVLTNGTDIDVASTNNFTPKLGNEQNPNAIDLLVYPNPARDVVSVDISSLANNGDIKTRIFTSGGRLIQSDDFGNDDAKLIKIDVATLPQGVYLIQVSSNSGWYNQELIIVR